jgi:hypothetical protein
MDNAAEFLSRAFNDYCMAQGIKVRHFVPYVHTQNCLTESLIKRIKLIARPLLQGCNLATSYWGHVVLHVVGLVQLRPTAYHTTSPLQLVHEDQPSISHLRKFGCVVHMPISPPKRTSMGPHRRMGIYVEYQSPSILKYLEPLMSDLFTTRFADCIFNEDHFLALGGDNKFITDGWEINWDDKSILSSDSRTKKIELQVQKIIELQQIASNLPDALTNCKSVTKSLNPAVNAPCRVKVPIKTTPPPKRGRSSQQKDASNKHPKTMRKPSSSKKVNVSQPKVDGHQVDVINSRPSPNVHTTEQAGGSEDTNSLVLGNHDEFSINYTSFGELHDCTTMVVNVTSPPFKRMVSPNQDHYGVSLLK